MKARITPIIPIFLIFVFLIIIVGWVFAPFLASKSTAHDIGNFEQSLANALSVLIQLSVSLIIIVLGFILIRLIIKYTRSYHLMIEPFQNATTDENMSKMLAGFNLLIRERLILTLKSWSDFLELYKTDGLSQSRSTYDVFYKIPIPMGTPIPGGTNDPRFSDLIKSLQDTESWELRIAVQIMNLIFLPHGMRVSGVFQCVGEPSAELGITLEVTDLRGKQEPKLYSLWKQETSAEPTKEPARSYDKSQQFIRELYPVVARWLAIEFMRQSLTEYEMSIQSEQMRKLHQAKLHNFIGLFHQSAGQTYEKFPEFYQLAIDDFKKAISLFNDWYLPVFDNPKVAHPRKK